MSEAVLTALLSAFEASDIASVSRLRMELLQHAKGAAKAAPPTEPPALPFAAVEAAVRLGNAICAACLPDAAATDAGMLLRPPAGDILSLAAAVRDCCPGGESGALRALDAWAGSTPHPLIDVVSSHLRAHGGGWTGAANVLAAIAAGVASSFHSSSAGAAGMVALISHAHLLAFCGLSRSLFHAVKAHTPLKATHIPARYTRDSIAFFRTFITTADEVGKACHALTTAPPLVECARALATLVGTVCAKQFVAHVGPPHGRGINVKPYRLTHTSGGVDGGRRSPRGSGADAHASASAPHLVPTAMYECAVLVHDGCGSSGGGGSDLFGAAWPSVASSFLQTILPHLPAMFDAARDAVTLDTPYTREGKGNDAPVPHTYVPQGVVSPSRPRTGVPSLSAGPAAHSASVGLTSLWSLSSPLDEGGAKAEGDGRGVALLTAGGPVAGVHDSHAPIARHHSAARATSVDADLGGVMPNAVVSASEAPPHPPVRKGTLPPLFTSPGGPSVSKGRGRAASGDVMVGVETAPADGGAMERDAKPVQEFVLSHPTQAQLVQINGLTLLVDALARAVPLLPDPGCAYDKVLDACICAWLRAQQTSITTITSVVHLFVLPDITLQQWKHFQPFLKCAKPTHGVSMWRLTLAGYLFDLQLCCGLARFQLPLFLCDVVAAPARSVPSGEQPGGEVGVKLWVAALTASVHPLLCVYEGLHPSPVRMEQYRCDTGYLLVYALSLLGHVCINALPEDCVDEVCHLLARLESLLCRVALTSGPAELALAAVTASLAGTLPHVDREEGGVARRWEWPPVLLAFARTFNVVVTSPLTHLRTEAVFDPLAWTGLSGAVSPGTTTHADMKTWSLTLSLSLEAFQCLRPAEVVDAVCKRHELGQWEYPALTAEEAEAKRAFLALPSISASCSTK